jgi:hypothetical protein
MFHASACIIDPAEKDAVSADSFIGFRYFVIRQSCCRACARALDNRGRPIEQSCRNGKTVADYGDALAIVLFCMFQNWLELVAGWKTETAAMESR